MKKNALVSQGWTVTDPELTQFTNENGVYQDGVLSLYRDSHGTLWSLAGHSYLGGISLWKGTSINNLSKQCSISYNFELGRAGTAFNGIPYPDGPRSRGEVWPFGLWIDPEDGKFYCFIHNETGWGAKDTSYTMHGQEEGEPDFRHIGLMTSVNEGRSWDFVDWIITSYDPCWTCKYQPDGMTGGQDLPAVCLGAGDFSFFANEQDGYFYIFYAQITFNTDTELYTDHVYAARAPISRKGMQDHWHKLYEGAYAEPGNMGRESAIINGGNVPNVSFNTYLNQYIMTSYHRPYWQASKGACRISKSNDLIEWSKPVDLDPDNKKLSNPYFTICNTNSEGPANVTGQKFTLLMETNGTDIYKMDVSIA